MKEIELNKDEFENNGIEISSVSSFINEVNNIKDKLHEDGSNEELFFRGQKADFWNIIPSIFRENYLSVEHILMQVPLLKTPYEFISIDNNFEIMTKYQHYGMCTRLVDLTTNPLVALYFACEKYGNVRYIIRDNEGNIENNEKKEAFGVIYYNHNYPIAATDIKVKIISALSHIDLSKENTFHSVLDQLVEQKIISNNERERWGNEDNYQEFINIIQNNYVVNPSYSNERLARQNGMFLLAGCFNFNYISPIKNSTLEKGYIDLRYEFDKTFFYIPGDKKESILNELDTYNINESTLFPELEHQLNYIKYKRRQNTKSATEFLKIEETSKNINTVSSSTKIIDDILTNDEFEKRILKMLTEEKVINYNEIWEAIKKIVSVVDWYKKESHLSHLKINIQKLLKNGKNPELRKRKAENIKQGVVNIAQEISGRSDN